MSELSRNYSVIPTVYLTVPTNLLDVPGLVFTATLAVPFAWLLAEYRVCAHKEGSNN